MRSAWLLSAALVACVGAGDAPEPPLDAMEPAATAVTPSAAEQERPPDLDALHDFGRRTARFELPGRLDEVSGLAFTPDGRLFAHDDERGRVHEIDPLTGEVGKRFDLGPDPVADDFEGLAVVGERFFLIASSGLLYEFREGADRADVPYRLTDTEVGTSCEVEGLDYDPGWNALLVPCKTNYADRGLIVIHRLPLDPVVQLSPITVPRSALAELGHGDEFAPSAIVVHGDLLVLASARQELLIGVDRASFALLSAVQLSQNRHPQPEGIALGPDGTLYIADERNGRDPRLTTYAPSGG